MRLGKRQQQVLKCFKDHGSGFSIYPVRQGWVWDTYQATLRTAEQLHEKGLLDYDQNAEKYLLSVAGAIFLGRGSR